MQIFIKYVWRTKPRGPLMGLDPGLIAHELSDYTTLNTIKV